ncbi:Radical SAM superfamily enzyme YgiQ, UPF0313 family [[Luteovulum] sphaeroides subsp. megalophilum]|uniref:B12-binding domain-containing radical SAM protein n=1 Tax=Cereibacter sphaeroides TaxID=1063 RepID=UPI000B757D16|nr:radical SAM protein [Cereibacter sphaeroides]SNT41257.1 Radical SAM superfamily enzyme YgiQ, UPF0313 family [[Luteovulum] sphaeroides subsp. megalophilum]
MADHRLVNYDIVFVNPAHHGPDYYAPIGIGMLATLARQNGYRATILDFQREVTGGDMPWPAGFFEPAEVRIAATRAPVYGFTSMNVGMPWAIRLARLVRQHHPEATIVFGGPHATLLGRELLTTFPEIDIVALREGEDIIVPLIEAVLSGDTQGLEKVPNLMFRRREGDFVETQQLPLKSNLDTLPLLELDPKVIRNVDIMSVEAGRGCPYTCFFCSSHAIWSRTPRFKSAERLADEAARYVEASGRDLIISYEHDDFLANRPVFRRFAEYKMQKQYDFKYCITARLNHITDEVRDLLVSSRCVSVFMGIETGSAELQARSSKHLRLDPVVPRIGELLESGIHVSANFIVGFPGEEMADICKSTDLMLAIALAGATVNISVMCPEPGSKLFDQTPACRHVVLADSTYVEELEAGGISLDGLTDVERYHLTTIESDNFDIREIGRFARSFQFLLGEFPLSLYLFTNTIDQTINLVHSVLGYQRRIDRRITESTAFDFFAPALAKSPEPRALEYLLYETCLASLQHSGGACAAPTAFGRDMPGAYHNRLAEVRQIAAKSGLRRTSAPTVGAADVG